MIVYAKLSLEPALSHIKNDMGRVTATWQAHFNKVNYDGAWSVFPLRTPGGTDSIIPDLMNEESYEDHPNMTLFPSVRQLVDTLQCEVMSVRLLNLSAGSVIKQHRDNELAFEKGEARLHIPVFTNPGVEFYVNNQRVVMNEGECWYINANQPHRVANNGATDRIHLVIDCRVNPWLAQLIQGSDTIAHAPDEQYSPEVLKQMIASLRKHNTETSNNLAAQFEQQLNNA